MDAKELGVYRGSYSWNGSWGAYEEIETLVIANTESEALGMILNEYPETKTDCWTVNEVDTGTVGVTWISGANS